MVTMKVARAAGVLLGSVSHDLNNQVPVSPGKAARVQRAVGAWRTLLTLGFRIPEDVSLIGFDNIEMGRLLLPPLSTVAQDISALGAHAAELLLNPSELPVHARSAIITPQLIHRGSTAAPRERSAM